MPGQQSSRCQDDQALIASAQKMQSMTGPLLSNEKWQAHLAEGEERHRLRDAAVSKVIGSLDEVPPDVSHWQEEVREATRTGAPIPPRPPEPDGLPTQLGPSPCSRANERRMIGPATGCSSNSPRRSKPRCEGRS